MRSKKIIWFLAEKRSVIALLSSLLDSLEVLRVRFCVLDKLSYDYALIWEIFAIFQKSHMKYSDWKSRLGAYPHCR